MIERLIIIVKLLFVYFAVTTIFDHYRMHVVKRYLAPYSYLADIDTPNLGDGRVRSGLIIFDRMSIAPIVQQQGRRPIYIHESDMEFFSWLSGAKPLGVAVNWPHRCDIYLNSDMKHDPTYYISFVVIHEYLHCLGYEHVDNPNDLMYYRLDEDRISLDSIRGYALSLIGIYYD